MTRKGTTKFMHRSAELFSLTQHQKGTVTSDWPLQLKYKGEDNVRMFGFTRVLQRSFTSLTRKPSDFGTKQ